MCKVDGEQAENLQQRNMSEENKSLLNQYFSSEDDGNQNSLRGQDDITDMSKQVASIRLDDEIKCNKDEPQVCRIFAETPPQPKDPTAAFFDLIGSSSSTTSTSGATLTDFGMSSTDVSIRQNLLLFSIL